MTVSNVYVGEGSDFSGVPTNMLTVNGSLRFTVRNLATIFGIHVSSTPINLLYSDISVATGQVRNSVPCISKLTPSNSRLTKHLEPFVSEAHLGN